MNISVLLSVYKKEKPQYLKEALDSVLSQTMQPDEIVLIKDGPLTAELEAVIEGYLTLLDVPNLVTYQFPENVKLGRALRKGVELCHSKYIARMDTDDIAEPKRLEKQYRYLENNPEVAVLGGYIEEFNDAGTLHQIKRMPTGQDLRKYGMYRNPVNHMTVMFRKEAVVKAGNYEDFPNLEDYHLWSRVMAQGDLLDNLPEVLVKARTNPDFYGRRGGWAYARRYMKLRRMQRKLGLLNAPQYVFACILTLGMVLSPGQLRKQFYRHILRR